MPHVFIHRPISSDSQEEGSVSNDDFDEPFFDARSLGGASSSNTEYLDADSGGFSRSSSPSNAARVRPLNEYWQRRCSAAEEESRFVRRWLQEPHDCVQPTCCGSAY